MRPNTAESTVSSLPKCNQLPYQTHLPAGMKVTILDSFTDSKLTMTSSVMWPTAGRSTAGGTGGDRVLRPHRSFFFLTSLPQTNLSTLNKHSQETKHGYKWKIRRSDTVGERCGALRRKREGEEHNDKASGDDLWVTYFIHLTKTRSKLDTHFSKLKLESYQMRSIFPVIHPIWPLHKEMVVAS